MNAVFLINLKKKTHRGLVGRVENGRSAGGISYGYRVVREIDARGEFERGIREIVPEQAAIIIRIFEAYANGHSPRQIAAELNAEGIPAPKLGPWDKSSITGKPALGTGILNNPLYNGMIVWNREKTVRNPRTDKYVLKPNPESEWVRKEVPELRIVPQALWDRVRARQAARMVRDRQDAVAWQQRPPKFLFTGLMRCGCCGGNVSSMGNERYGCSNARTKGRAICTNRSTVSRKDMDARVLGALADRLMDPDLVKAFVEAYAEELKKLSEARKPNDIAAMKRELGKVIADQDRLVEALISGVPAERVKARMEGLAARQKVLEAELAREVTPPPANPIRPDLADAWHDRIRALVASVSDPNYAGETREHIRSLVEKVVMYPVPGPGKRPRPALDLHGALAQILRLGCLGAGAGPKETAQIEAGLAQTQVLMETRGGSAPSLPRPQPITMSSRCTSAARPG